MLLEISQNSQENACARVSFLITLQASGVIFDKNLNWNEHLNTIENKVSRNIDILYKNKETINKKGLRSLYYSFIHKLLIYGNLSWESRHKTNLKQVAWSKKQAIRIIDSDTVTRTTEKMETLKILNIYKINLY